MATVAVAAKAIVESGGLMGRQGGGGDRSDSCRGVQWLSSDAVDDHRSTGKSWSNTSPNNDGGGGSGGEKNRHTTSSYQRQTAILPDYTDHKFGGVDVGVSGAHPRKDDDESGGRGETCDYRGD